ncbi:hypothetical protein [Actinosynnema sp. ALI-1.44]|uniref:hypothetical protein n=1 Tax=Actinosynnema sp. ALI-1.44 TaxID=1933779 RepID=UPI000A03C418|nr:hypothetical protein [Actinosynnema sp. ALI-1.44]
MKNTITQQEANNRAEKYTQDAAASLTPPPRLEPLSRFDDTECDDPSDNGPLGRVYASRRYWLRDVPRERNAEVAEALVRWWTSHDFVVLSDKRPRENWISVENKNDGFSMSIQESVNGDLSLGATSPCVWPNGTPAPKPG